MRPPRALYIGEIMSTVTRATSTRTRQPAKSTPAESNKGAGRVAAQNSGSRRVWESAPSAKKPTVRLDQAVRAAITKAGFGFLTSLKPVSDEALPQKVAEVLEVFGETNGASGQGCSIGALKIGKQQVYVLGGANEDGAVVFTAVDSKGKELAQGQITADDQFRLTMKFVNADGKPGATVCTMQYDKKGDITDAAWIAKAKAAFLATEHRDDFGDDVEGKKLPPAVTAQFDFLSRRASDSFGVRAFTIDGTKAYLLCDYSSVTSYYAVAPNGRLLFDHA